MRLNECEQVQRDLSDALGINLTVVEASERFLDGLKGIEDPEVCAAPFPWFFLHNNIADPLQKKRKFIGMPSFGDLSHLFTAERSQLRLTAE